MFQPRLHRSVQITTDQYNVEFIPVFTTNLTPDGYILNFSKLTLAAKASNAIDSITSQVSNTVTNLKNSTNDDVLNRQMPTPAKKDNKFKDFLKKLSNWLVVFFMLILITLF